MKNDLKQFTVFKERDTKTGSIIQKIEHSLLLTSDKFKTLNDESLELFANQGFVIGNHSIKKLENWISNKENSIYVVKSTKKEQDEIIGYALIMAEDKIIKEVQEYEKNIKFSEPEARSIIRSGSFIYLIQIAIKKEYHNQKIGSKLFQTICNEAKKPIISFVIKNPLENKPSLHIHQKNGFRLFGIYTGNYGNFSSYESYGLFYTPRS